MSNRVIYTVDSEMVQYKLPTDRNPKYCSIKYGYEEDGEECFDSFYTAPDKEYFKSFGLTLTPYGDIQLTLHSPLDRSLVFNTDTMSEKLVQWLFDNKDNKKLNLHGLNIGDIKILVKHPLVLSKDESMYYMNIKINLPSEIKNNMERVKPTNLKTYFTNYPKHLTLLLDSLDLRKYEYEEFDMLTRIDGDALTNPMYVYPLLHFTSVYINNTHKQPTFSFQYKLIQGVVKTINEKDPPKLKVV